MGKEVDIIKEKIDIAEFLRGYIHLTPAGRNLKGLCPFHGEKTPSFIVSPDKKIWHCFGCGEGGDVLSFVIKYEHVEFPEALRLLADRVGIPMRNISPTQEREFGIFYDMHEAATLFFSEQLEKNKNIISYLQKRGLSEDTRREFRLGYNPLGDSLGLHLASKGFDYRDISRAGLIQKIRGLNRDRFEGRIIFPLFNSLGRVVAFAGRIIDDNKKNGEIAKYLNSPETQIFNKSKILYGFHTSKHSINETRSVFLTEGYMDFLMSWQSGIKNAVAVAGTALTEEHLERLRRFADTALVSFDSDSAGFRALERSIDSFHQYDFHVKVVDMGKYKDPAEAVSDDSSFLLSAVQNAKPVFEYLLLHYFPENDEKEIDIAARKRFISYLLKRIVKMKSPVEQDIWVRKLARAADVGESAIFEEFRNLKMVDQKKVNAFIDPKIKIPREDMIAEKLLILGFAHPDFWAILKEKQELFPEKFRFLINSPDDERNEMIRMQGSYEFQSKGKKELDIEFFEMLSYLELEKLQKEQDKLKRSMRIAESTNKDDELSVLTKKFQLVSKRIQELKFPKSSRINYYGKS